MGQFKPMVKMTTTEPSVMLKLKDGGHVNMKKGGHAKQEKESGHKAMPKMMDGGAMGALASTPALVGRPAVNAPVRSPGRPSMSARRRAMAAKPSAAPAGGVMKKGGEAKSGKTAKMSRGGLPPTIAGRSTPQPIYRATPVIPMPASSVRQVGSGQSAPGPTPSQASSPRVAMPPQAPSARLPMPPQAPAGRSAMPPQAPAGRFPMPSRAPGMMRKKGGEVESPAEHKSEMKAIKGLKTELKSHESKPASKGHKGLKNGGSTGGVKEGNAGGYRNGGTVGDQMGDETTSGTPETTIMHSAKARRGQGTTGGVQEAQGGYANGGNVSRYVTNNVVSTPPGVTNMTTGSVRKGNAGGYKKGGSSKKGYATGGLVDTGRPVAMPRKPASKPVSNNRQSGTFKKGGAVEHRLEGGPLGSVTKTRESVTVTPAKKRGGMMC